MCVEMSRILDQPEMQNDVGASPDISVRMDSFSSQCSFNVWAISYAKDWSLAQDGEQQSLKKVK